MREFSYEDLLGNQYGEFADGPNRWNCWGVIREMHRRIGVELPDLNSVYRGSLPPRGDSRSEVAYRNELAATILAEAEAGWEQVEEPGFGVVALLRVNRKATHMGFMIDRYRFIHVLEDPMIEGSTDVVVVHRLDSWEHKLESLNRWKRSA